MITYSSSGVLTVHDGISMALNGNYCHLVRKHENADHGILDHDAMLPCTELPVFQSNIFSVEFLPTR